MVAGLNVQEKSCDWLPLGEFIKVTRVGGHIDSILSVLKRSCNQSAKISCQKGNTNNHLQSKIN